MDNDIDDHDDDDNGDNQICDNFCFCARESKFSASVAHLQKQNVLDSFERFVHHHHDDDDHDHHDHDDDHIIIIIIITFIILSPTATPDNWGELGHEPRPEIGNNPLIFSCQWQYCHHHHHKRQPSKLRILVAISVNFRLSFETTFYQNRFTVECQSKK